MGSKWRPGDAVGAEWSEANTGDEGPVIETAPGKLRSCTRWDPGPRGGDDDSIVEVALDGGSPFWWTRMMRRGRVARSSIGRGGGAALSRGGGSGDVARKESPVGSIGGRLDRTRAAPLLFRAEPLWPTG